MVKCDHLLNIPEAVSAGPVPKFLPSLLCPNKKARAIGHRHDLTASRKHFLSVFPEKERKYATHFSSVAQSCLTLCDPMDCSTPGFPVHH